MAYIRSCFVIKAGSTIIGTLTGIATVVKSVQLHAGYRSRTPQPEKMPAFQPSAFPVASIREATAPKQTECHTPKTKFCHFPLPCFLEKDATLCRNLPKADSIPFPVNTFWEIYKNFVVDRKGESNRSSLHEIIQTSDCLQLYNRDGTAGLFHSHAQKGEILARRFALPYQRDQAFLLYSPHR